MDLVGGDVSKRTTRPRGPHPYRYHPSMSTLHLERLLAPRSVAVVGASARDGSPGLALVRNLVDGGYEGELHLVNPRYDEVLGRPCVRSLKSLDAAPDLVLVLTPERLLNRTLVQCAKLGTKLVIVMSGAPDPAKLHDYARRLGLRILGPWCAGLIRPHLKLNATYAASSVQPGTLAVVSQSASLAAALVDWAQWSGVGFSALVSTGGGSDIRLPDLLDLLAEDYRTRAIIVYLDRVQGSRAFLSALAATARAKPVILMKSTQDGAHYCNALTRSGRVLSSDAVFQAALARAGVVRIRTFSNLFSAAKILSSKMRTRGRRLAVVSNGAAPAMLACENIETRGFRSPTLDEATLERLGQALDDGAPRRDRGRWTGRNPIVLRDPPRLAQQLAAAVRTLAAADEFDAVLFIFVPDARNDPALVARALIEAKPTRLPLLACWMGDASVGPAREALTDAGVPNFRTPEAATAGFDFLHRYHVSQQQLVQLPNPMSRTTPADLPAARAVLHAALAANRRVLAPAEARALAAAFDIGVLPGTRCADADAAVAAAAGIDGAVAIKLVSPHVEWKASVWPTALNVRGEPAVRAAFDAARDALAEHRPDARFDGVLVEPMHAPVQRRELAVGIRRDASFGPVISLGVGGELAVLARDRTVQLPPLNGYLIDSMLEDPSIARHLGAFRHLPAVDREPLRAVLRRLSEMACELPELVELEIDPLILGTDGAIAIDLHVVVERAPAVQRYGHLAIHPYPWQWVRETSAKDGTPVTLRPIRPEDGESLGDMVRAMSAQSRYFRFLHAINELSPLMRAQFTKLDYDRAMAFVADFGDDRVAGVSRYSIDSDGRAGEFAVSVADDRQGLGLGSRLMRLLIEHATERGLERLWGDVLRENAPMRALMASLGFKARRSDDDPELLIYELALDPAPGSASGSVAQGAGASEGAAKGAA